MLANVIKFVVTSMSGPDEAMLKHSLEHLARVHNQKNISDYHYSTMGMVLVHTVRICTGTLYFTHRHHDAWVSIYSKMMAVIIPEVVSNRMPGDDETTDMAKVAEQLYKKGNLNAEADASTKKPNASKSHSDDVKPFSSNGASSSAGAAAGASPSPPPGCSVSPLSADAVSLCPAHAFSPVEDATVSDDLAKHLTANAAELIGTLGGASGKYAVLTRILAIAQRVEAHLSSEVKLTDALPLGSITGAGLVHLLQEKNWVNSSVGSKVACEHFLQLQLMKRISNITETSPDDRLFHDNASTVYSFIFPTQTTPSGGSIRNQSLQSPHSPNEFEPQNFGRGFLPTDNILHALSPQNFPGQPVTEENSE